MSSHSTDVDGGGISGTLTDRTGLIAAVLALSVVAVLLFVLDSIAVPLWFGDVLRTSGAAGIAGGESIYSQHVGLWLGVRAIMGAYIVFVAIFISILAISTWKEVLE
ncbi:MAG: hypothetical protein ACOCRC_00750 [Halodesulfurarchaeum sp.]